MFKLSRMDWSFMSRQAQEAVAENIDSGADLNFLGIWLEHDFEIKEDRITVGWELSTLNAEQMLAMLTLHFMRDKRLTALEVADLFAWAIKQRMEEERAEEEADESTETPETEPK